ncbi:hypothetical protein BU15DRAFT_77220 [Melanogaster broomeanus]|nr:hypothetical protein BU15DRAFT_77220 [Melanogaster broomeanus]
MRKAEDARNLEQRMRSSLEHGRMAEDIKSVRLDKVISRASTKHMIARPLLVLALHLNRSLSYGQFAMKNSIRVIFPEILDLTPFTITGNLSTVFSIPISAPLPTLPRSTTPTQPSTLHVGLSTAYLLSSTITANIPSVFTSASEATRVLFRMARPTTLHHDLSSSRLQVGKVSRYGCIRNEDDAMNLMYRLRRG